VPPYRLCALWQELAVLQDEVVRAWQRGKLILDGVPFAHAIAELDRYRPGCIVLLPGAARHESVSGMFALDRPSCQDDMKRPTISQSINALYPHTLATHAGPS
jgi:ferric-dicitrate binding protein FerR (iron transport regulator)